MFFILVLMQIVMVSLHWTYCVHI